jgi:hypothetical protein
VDATISAVSAGKAPAPIVLEASAPGLTSATVTVATSINPSGAMLEVASK